MTTKLIIVEGLPGSGKSTTAKMVYDVLKEKGVEVELCCEGNYNHPADFEGVAYFNNEDFNILRQAYPESGEILDKIKVKYFSGYIIPYKKAIEEQQVTFKEELFSDITKNDIYELPMKLHIELILNRWSDFAVNCIKKNKVIIFECCFIQNPVTVSMIKNNCENDITMNYITNLEGEIKELEPILIYVEQQDIKTSFKKAVHERPSEWFEGFSNYYTKQGYGLANNLSGLDGVIKVLEERSRLENEIYNSLKLCKYKIDNSSFNHDLLKEKVNSILKAYF